ncbi:hypothetical protein [Novosphingobium album (ex Liu et al. 2023)]|uniref:Uncharacterized protein n=1 Tax=Novosphingobium album (ex Liu et al. 2023) TaxID=3031130 RepID=A0ABT5WYA5_9SPHN|nr:hypothetical protein [Novosphingobium album (ex Liu et al. 2023)]MDE8654766.1 hypothetical protein [Novosphingobium album (ex Liu et al. 2023)]
MDQIVNYVRGRGESIAIAVIDDEAIAGVTVAAAWLKRLVPGERVLTEVAVPTVSFDVAFRAATEDVDEGWTFSLDPAASAALEIGYYQLGWSVTDGGAVAFGPTATVQIREI